MQGHSTNHAIVNTCPHGHILYLMKSFHFNQVKSNTKIFRPQSTVPLETSLFLSHWFLCQYILHLSRINHLLDLAFISFTFQKTPYNQMLWVFLPILTFIWVMVHLKFIRKNLFSDLMAAPSYFSPSQICQQSLKYTSFIFETPFGFSSYIHLFKNICWTKSYATSLEYNFDQNNIVP